MDSVKSDESLHPPTTWSCFEEVWLSMESPGVICVGVSRVATPLVGTCLGGTCGATETQV